MPSDRFLKCQAFVRGREGGWCLEKEDAGGETLFGVARNANPYWPGWSLVDVYAVRFGRGTDQFKAAVNGDRQLYDMAMELFEESYWTPIRGEELPYEVAVLIYDVSVNSGPSRACKIIQKAIRSSNGDPTVNGKLTDAQIQFLNDIFLTDSKNAYLEVLISKRAMFYAWLIESKPSQERFRNGWRNRLMFLSTDILGYVPDWLRSQEIL